MNMRGEGTQVAAQQGILRETLLAMKRDLANLDIDARQREALLARIDALTQAVSEAQALADAATSVLDRIALGVALVDMAGTVVWSNRYLSEIVALEDGLTVRAGRLQAPGPGQTNELDQLIERARALGRNGDPAELTVHALHRDDRLRPFLIAAVRLDPNHPIFDGDRQLVAVFVADPRRREQLPAGDLEQLFGLTPAESQVAALLAGGDRLDIAAGRLGVTTGTARTHLKHIFDKTGTGRQSELSHLLHTLHGRLHLDE